MCIINLEDVFSLLALKFSLLICLPLLFSAKTLMSCISVFSASKIYENTLTEVEGKKSKNYDADQIFEIAFMASIQITYYR